MAVSRNWCIFHKYHPYYTGNIGFKSGDSFICQQYSQAALSEEWEITLSFQPRNILHIQAKGDDA